MEISVILKSLFFTLCLWMLSPTYAFVIIYSSLYLNLGIFSLPYTFTMLTPIIVVLIVIQRRRDKREYEYLMKPPQVWDIDKFTKEYVELLKKHRD